MSTVINFYGGPGTGKSTTAARVFSNLKQMGKNAEYVQEYVKQWAWENRKPSKYDQFYFFGKQVRKEYSLFNAVDLIITDSPICLSAYYSHLFGSKDQSSVFIEMAKNFYKEVTADNNEYIHVWLKRVKGYNPKGRFQTEEEAIAIDSDMRKFLENEIGLTFIDIDATNESADNFCNVLASSQGRYFK